MRWLILLIVIAGVAGFFTRPEREQMSAAADHFISSNSNPIEAIGTQISGATEGRSYDNYYVAARYMVGDAVTCWGAFKQVQCSRSKPADSK